MIPVIMSLVGSLVRSSLVIAVRRLSQSAFRWQKSSDSLEARKLATSWGVWKALTTIRSHSTTSLNLKTYIQETVRKNSELLANLRECISFADFPISFRKEKILVTSCIFFSYMEPHVKWALSVMETFVPQGENS